jgi:hypothetical protein
MSGSRRLENKDSPLVSGKSVGVGFRPSDSTPPMPTKGQRFFFWMMTAVLAGWLLLLGLLAWWARG